MKGILGALRRTLGLLQVLFAGRRKENSTELPSQDRRSPQDTLESGDRRDSHEDDSHEDQPTPGEFDGAAGAVDDIAEEGASPRRLGRVVQFLFRSARKVGARGVMGGRWGAEVLMGLSQRVNVRDRFRLAQHHPGLQGRDLAEAVVRNAARTTAAVGAAAGALATVEEFAPPAWLAIPLELAAETVVVAAIEVKMVAELHELFGVPVTGGGMARTRRLLTSWADRRGVTPVALVRNRGQLPKETGGQPGRAELARDEVLRLVRRRLIKSMTGNLASLGPLLTGALAGAEINRRTTRALGHALMNDLARLHGWPGTITVPSRNDDGENRR